MSTWRAAFARVPQPVTCDVGKPVTVARISDQDRASLQFAEKHRFRPGDAVQVEERAPKPTALVRVRTIAAWTIGARAASEVLVHAAEVVVMLLDIFPRALRRTAPAAEPFRIASTTRSSEARH